MSYLAGYKTTSPGAVTNLGHHATTQTGLHTTGTQVLNSIFYQLEKDRENNCRNNMIVSVHETNWMKKFSQVINPTLPSHYRLILLRKTDILYNSFHSSAFGEIHTNLTSQKCFWETLYKTPLRWNSGGVPLTASGPKLMASAFSSLFLCFWRIFEGVWCRVTHPLPCGIILITWAQKLSQAQVITKQDNSYSL